MANMARPLSYGTLLLVFISVVGALVDEQADRVVPALRPRATFYGGFALSEQQCPSGTISCGTSTHDCCPAGTVCRSDISEFCCPSESDCTPTVRSIPVCADTSWVLFRGKDTGYFCCEPGEQGIYPTAGVGGIGLCLASGMSVAPSQTAFMYSSAAGGSPSATGLVSSLGASSAPISSGGATPTGATAVSGVTGTGTVQNSPAQTGTGTTQTSPAQTSTSTKSGAGGSISSWVKISIAYAIGGIGLFIVMAMQ